MEMNQDKMANTEIFKLSPVDIDYLFRRSGLKGNSLSAFRYNAEQAATGSPSEFFKALAESPRFNQIVRRLLEPDLKIEFKRGGNGTAEEKYHVLLSGQDKAVAAQFVNSEGDLLVLLFDDWESYLEWWSGIYASTGMGNYQVVFPDIMETEVLICALHCIDIYRRSYMESMLEYSGNLNLSLATQDFVQLLKRALSSQDKRWLLPTLFELTPGLKNSNISLKPEHIRQAEEIGFAVSNEGVLTLDERARIMGTEFITSWMGAVGFRATSLIKEEERSLSQVFLATTAFANHLCSFENGAEGDTRFRHQALNVQELKQTLAKWMEALQKVIGQPVPAKTGESTAPKTKFCGHCGAEIKAGKKFCTACGSAI
ncbi:MAG TPA: zinc ribbon domain-containing protein [Desulfitobacteriaceae bacterium]|nr:zinc ribbon domain-containing protein [Desulfitobacteriaceae bacterium]